MLYTEFFYAKVYYKNDPQFQAELDDLLENYAGRPSLLYEAKKMGKTRVIAETGAGQHGVATATAAA